MYEELFSIVPQPCLVAEVSGALLASNKAARSVFQPVRLSDPVSLFDLFEVDRLKADILRASGASSWQPTSAVIARGSLSGLNQQLRMRGLRIEGRDDPVVVVVVEKDPASGFREHTDLIRRLNCELAEQRRLRSRLERAVEKERYLHGELIHRVKNNLSLLASLISLRARSEQNENARDALRAIELRTRSIALVHDLLDRNETLEVINAGELIEELCKLMNESLLPDNITLNCDVEALELHNQDATSLCLLINELLTNSLKHAFTGSAGGRIDLNFAKNGIDKMELSVRDDGAGMDVHNHSADSHGTQILHALAANLNGELIHNSSEGTEWTLIFHPQAPQYEAAE